MHRSRAVTTGAEPRLVQIRVRGVRRDRFTRWRAATLVGVHVLIGLHFAHWALAGSTLAPLELNEVLYTLHLGIVTAGFLLMVTAALATAVFGRFFCGWGCHLLALQDVAGWMLHRLRLHPRPVRSRALGLAAPIALVYLFVWPQIERILAGRPLPALRVLGEHDGWSSFVTSDPWRNLPGPVVAIATFVVCGGLIVYLLGTRAFCQVACPYGVVFGLLDRLAPGRIVARGACDGCGQCTAVCQSHVRVHEEIQTRGRVVDPRCLRDLDCVAACPKGVLRYGLTRPGALDGGPLPRRWDLSMGEEILAFAACSAAFLATRGLYDTIPFLLALGLGCVAGGIAVLSSRLARGRNVRIAGWVLGSPERVTPAGRAFLALATCSAMLLVHSAIVRVTELRADAAIERAVSRGSALVEAEARVEECRQWSLIAPSARERRLASVALGHGDLALAERALRRVLSDAPDDREARSRLGATLARTGRGREAIVELRRAVESAPSDARLRVDLAVALAVEGRTREAASQLRVALRHDPRLAIAHTSLGLLLAEDGDFRGAAEHLRVALQLDPRENRARIALARLARPVAPVQDEQLEPANR